MLFQSRKTRQDTNFQGISLFQAMNITKTNNGTNNLSAASWVLPATLDVCTKLTCMCIGHDVSNMMHKTDDI